MSTNSTIEEYIQNLERSTYIYPETQERYHLPDPKYTVLDIIKYSTVCHERKYNNKFFSFWGVNTFPEIFEYDYYSGILDSMIFFNKNKLVLSNCVCTLDTYNFNTLEDIFHLQLSLSYTDIMRLYIAKKFISLTNMKYGVVQLDVNNIKEHYFIKSLQK